MAGHTPSVATEAQHRKRNELIGELIAAGREIQKPDEGSATPTRITDAVETFLAHVRVHSPDKPKTHQRYRKVLEHFERVLGKKKYMEAITRADMDDYKIHRHVERSIGRIPWLLSRGHTVLEHVEGFGFLVFKPGLGQHLATDVVQRPLAGSIERRNLSLGTRIGPGCYSFAL